MGKGWSPLRALLGVAGRTYRRQLGRDVPPSRGGDAQLHPIPPRQLRGNGLLHVPGYRRTGSGHGSPEDPRRDARAGQLRGLVRGGGAQDGRPAGRGPPRPSLGYFQVVPPRLLSSPASPVPSGSPAAFARMPAI